MIDFIAYTLVRVLNLILGFIPISVSLWAGRRIGTLIFLFNKKRRLVAYANLRYAFCGEKTPAELKAITKRVYQNMAQTFVEVLNLTKVNRRYVDKYVEVVNIERIRNAATSGRGTILLTAHFGDWELSSLVSSVEGFPIMVLAREQKMKRLNELLNRLRESNGCKVIRKGMQTKSILRALRDNNIVGILSDQDAGKSGTFVDFFGRQTSCHSGPMEIAKHTDSLIIPNFIVRTKGPYHKLYLEDYIDFRAAPSADDIRVNLQKFSRILESYVRKYPDQWLWLHKRWKSTPGRTVLVLNDGKAGHLNQSLALARQIQKARATQGCRLSDTAIVVKDVKFKNAFLRNSLTHLCGPYAGWRCHGCMRCMSVSLQRKNYEDLMSTCADFVVSCGSSLAAANILIARENNAKNIIVMRPNIFMGLGKFDLAVIPKHDDPPARKNVVATTVAPNLIDDAILKEGAAKLQETFKIADGDFVGLFIGGGTPELSLGLDVMDGVLNGMIKFCSEHGVKLLVTTSRRTHSSVESLLKSRLKAEPCCALLVIANEKNPPESVSGMLGLSKAVVVSGESISMISEAVSSGKKVVVFELTRKTTAITKHEKALRRLESDGYLSFCKSDGVFSCLEKSWDNNTPSKTPDDNQRILAAIRRII